LQQKRTTENASMGQKKENTLYPQTYMYAVGHRFVDGDSKERHLQHPGPRDGPSEENTLFCRSIL